MRVARKDEPVRPEESWLWRFSDCTQFRDFMAQLVAIAEKKMDCRYATRITKAGCRHLITDYTGAPGLERMGETASADSARWVEVILYARPEKLDTLREPDLVIELMLRCDSGNCCTAEEATSKTVESVEFLDQNRRAVLDELLKQKRVSTSTTSSRAKQWA